MSAIGINDNHETGIIFTARRLNTFVPRREPRIAEASLANLQCLATALRAGASSPLWISRLECSYQVQAYRNGIAYFDVSDGSEESPLPGMSAAPADEPEPSPPSPQLTRKQRKKIGLIDRFIRSLDALVFAQISVLYYCDTSTFLLVLRLVSQIQFVSPTSDSFRSPPRLPPVLVANLIAFAAHLIQGRPEPQVGARGYLHGGLILDFVGQKSVSTWKLVALDIFVFGLQILMLMGALSNFKKEEPLSAVNTASIIEDLDAEEAGRPRNQDQDDEDGIELDDLSNRELNNPPESRTLKNAPGESVLEFNIVEGIQALLRASTVPPATVDLEGGLLSSLRLRLAATGSQPGSTD